MKIINVFRKDAEEIFFNIVFVGAGANGSVAIRNFLQDLRTHLNAKHPLPFSCNITLIDGDKVEKKNLDNQIFIEEDIGQYKVDVLADRYGEIYRLKVMRITEYLKDIVGLSKIMTNQTKIPVKCQQINVLVGLVDNNRSRQLFDEFFYSDNINDLIYIDAGVEGVEVNAELSQSERDRTGFSGQVVCGLKIKGKVVLEPVGRIYTNILDDTLTSFPEESCGELIINNPQRSETNKYCAQHVNIYLNNLLHTQSIYSHYINFNAQVGGANPKYIDKRAYLLYKEIEEK